MSQAAPTVHLSPPKPILPLPKHPQDLDLLGRYHVLPGTFLAICKSASTSAAFPVLRGICERPEQRHLRGHTYLVEWPALHPYRLLSAYSLGDDDVKVTWP